MEPMWHAGLSQSRPQPGAPPGCPCRTSWLSKAQVGWESPSPPLLGHTAGQKWGILLPILNAAPSPMSSRTPVGEEPKQNCRGTAVPTACQPAWPHFPARWRPGRAASGTHPAQDPAPGSKTLYSPPPPAAAHGAWGHGRDSRGRAEHAAQPRLPGEASARLTYFSFRITCFHFPSPWLGPPARPQPCQVTPPALGAQGTWAPQLLPHEHACKLATHPRTQSMAGVWVR